MHQKLSCFLLACISFSAIKAQKALLRHPAVHPNGAEIAFSYQGDIWTVPVSGGKANRLTIHEGYESGPVYSPDGKQIAFSGNRYGNTDVFVISNQGGLPKRLTWHSAGDQVMGWNQPDQIVFSTAREFRQVERPMEVYSISPNGGTEKRILDAVGHSPVVSPNGRFIVMERGDINPVARHQYRGSSNRELWLYNTQTKKYSKLPGFNTNDVLPRWAGNETIYFLSSDAGAYNIYRLKISGDGQASKPEAITKFKDEAIRHFDVSADGNTLVYEKEMDLFVIKNGVAPGQAINIQLNADERLDPQETKTFTNGGGEFQISPNGKLMAFSIRGEIFIKENDKEKSRTINVSNHAFRDMEPTWLNDSTLLFISDRNDGNFDIYAVQSADTGQHHIFKSLKHQITRITKTTANESDLSVSNNGGKLAYLKGQGNLVVASISADGKLGAAVALTEGWNDPGNLAWSPDDQWLAYSRTDLNFNNEIFIQAADNSTKPVNVSMHPRGDYSPVWSPDGSKLGFVSARNNRSNDIWFVWLKKEDWEKSTQDWLEQDAPPAETPAKGKTPVKPVVIDFENIHERLVQVTSLPGNESGLAISKNGEIFYYTAGNSTSNDRDLYSVKWNGREMKELTKGGTNPANVKLDREGKYLYFSRMGGAVSRLDTKGAGQPEALPYSAKLKVDYRAEREQVFDEAWRTLRDGFYDPNFHGQNWKALKEKYRERCVEASTTEDFRDMFNLLLGELNASHMGLNPTPRTETRGESTGLLGAELTPENNGMRIGAILPETAADKKESKLTEGELITHVNGEAYSTNTNFFSLLIGKSGEKTILTVQDKAGKTREVVIRPQQSIVNNLYQNWVNERKNLVDQWSGGKLGYIHIRSMDMASFEVVEREFMAAGYGKDGLVIDVRYNGGGSTADYLMAVLNYKQHAYTIPRGSSNDLEKDKLKFTAYYPTGERLVFAAWTKPSIALCNEGSYSNAEIFSHAYKQLGIGKLVGLPTNGSVISTGSRSMMDGSTVRLPSRGWFTKATHLNQELNPAIPDIIVENNVNWIAEGSDAQLKKAVEELLKETGK